MIGPSLDVLNPPLTRHLFAILLAAATTLDSSRQKGMRYGEPSITKLVATPTGNDIVPITFSIMRSAAISSNSPWLASAAIASGLSFANSATICLLCSTESL